MTVGRSSGQGGSGGGRQRQQWRGGAPQTVLPWLVSPQRSEILMLCCAQSQRAGEQEEESRPRGLLQTPSDGQQDSSPRLSHSHHASVRRPKKPTPEQWEWELGTASQGKADASEDSPPALRLPLCPSPGPPLLPPSNPLRKSTSSAPSSSPSSSWPLPQRPLAHPCYCTPYSTWHATPEGRAAARAGAREVVECQGV